MTSGIFSTKSWNGPRNYNNRAKITLGTTVKSFDDLENYNKKSTMKVLWDINEIHCNYEDWSEKLK